MAAQTTFEKMALSGSTSGQGIVVAATATPGTLIHTAVNTGASDYDEIVLYCMNTSGGACKLTIEYGGPEAGKNIIFTVLAQDGCKCIVPGFLLQGGLTIKAFAAVTNVLTIYGHVMRGTV